MGKLELYVINTEGRECKACWDFKTWDHFHKNPTMKTLHASKCIECIHLQKKVKARKKGMRLKDKCRVSEDGRECTVCRKFLGWDNFSRHKLGINGKLGKCRECCSVRSIKYEDKKWFSIPKEEKKDGGTACMDMMKGAIIIAQNTIKALDTLKTDIKGKSKPKPVKAQVKPKKECMREKKVLERQERKTFAEIQKQKRMNKRESEKVIVDKMREEQAQLRKENAKNSKRKKELERERRKVEGLNIRGLKVNDVGRQCTVCTKFLEWDNFGINKAVKYGRDGCCKACKKKLQEDRRAKLKMYSAKLTIEKYDPSFITEQRKRMDERIRKEEAERTKKNYWEV